jgi:Asp-tRNA(Asn)/Glu-tRNA(Gln) amidotransferase A subunit family amidase
MDLFNEAAGGDQKEEKKGRIKPNVSIKLPDEYIQMWEDALKELDRQGIKVTKTDFLKEKIFEAHYKLIVMGQQDLFKE